MKFIVAYDIENNKNRTKLYEKLKDMGLIAVQKSVFYGEISKPEIAIIKIYFKEFCNRNDRAFIAPCEIDYDLSFGYNKEIFEFKSVLVL